MNQTIKLDVVSDVVCPWCIIGYKRLEQAIRELGVEDRIDLEWQPFELNPHMPLEGQNLREHLAEKYGTTKEDSIRAREQLTQLGREVGFTFDYSDEMKMLNTFEAHILLEYAKEQGKQTDLKLRLFSAFFGEGKDISNREVLANELAAVGLDSKSAIARLDDPNARLEVQHAEETWKNLGISSVPTVVFNRQSALTGAQPVEVYKQVLQELLAQ
ncbi:DsbA family oxidoreductase [Vibrio hangzhouensis]|uniref:DsbA family oxidoreductase n=1 Tax=Vibrio hangzhouensis TaxID=462991 RepID=UPI001C964119|nr:DsbA family oxidoreductase [Vibrio hangzhouensis]MBY6195813.1 DsbA family oxidoreductase [Vibrio hangzhouensis]